MIWFIYQRTKSSFYVPIDDADGGGYKAGEPVPPQVEYDPQLAEG